MLSKVEAVLGVTIYGKNNVTPVKVIAVLCPCFVYPKKGRHADSDEDKEACKALMVLGLLKPRAFVTHFDDLRALS